MKALTIFNTIVALYALAGYLNHINGRQPHRHNWQKI